jgi:hypothetical protein
VLTSDTGGKADVFFSVTVVQLHDIDDDNGRVVLTLFVSLQWRDLRLRDKSQRSQVTKFHGTKFLVSTFSTIISYWENAKYIQILRQGKKGHMNTVFW